MKRQTRRVMFIIYSTPAVFRFVVFLPFQVSRHSSADNVLSVGWILGVLQPHPHLVTLSLPVAPLVNKSVPNSCSASPVCPPAPVAALPRSPGAADGAGSVGPAGVPSGSGPGRPAVPALSPPAGLPAARQPALPAPPLPVQGGVQVCASAPPPPRNGNHNLTPPPPPAGTL